jgi:regulator of extracellular matrix RemA (YlzA/DUF370 family)
MLVLISIGFKNYLKRNSIDKILKAGSARAEALTRSASDKGKLIDATNGRPVKSIILLKNGFIVLCYLRPEALAERLAEQTPQPETPKNSVAMRMQDKRQADLKNPAGHSDRRVECDRRRWRYTLCIPERRSGLDRRSKKDRRL